MIRSGWTLAGVCWLVSGTAVAGRCGIEVHPIDSYKVPAATQVDGYRFGGISGLDYDSRGRQWYFVSDDRTEYPAARLFTAQLKFDSHRVIDVTLQSGKLVDSDVATDAETIRVDSKHRELLLAGEGDLPRKVGPWLRRVDFSGHELQHVPLPVLFDPSDGRGPRPNGSIEGITFDAKGRGLWISLETPLLQDGPPASMEHGVDVRFTLRRADNSMTQYVYPVDAARTHAAGESSDSGVSEILALGEHELLVLERSGVKHAEQNFSFHTRLYCADLHEATDVASFDSLSGRSYRRATKQLLFDFDSLPGIVVDNLEAMSWGPALPGSQRSLVFASDNNMVPGLATQFIFFSVSR
jgi:hypothetical protein